ncbi:hypothetical protein BGP_6553 [Beggiatoa sp. PS]|nr:hypothetical protein BGP_6553 [Beggiatoa sp. PS]
MNETAIFNFGEGIGYINSLLRYSLFAIISE